MRKKQDLRVQRTVQSIKETFLSLLEERPFEKIQVSDIAARAMINRGTFYLHYQDKYDLLESMCEDFIADGERQVKGSTPEDILRCYQEKRPLPHMVNMLEKVAKNPKFFQLITDSEMGDAFYTKFSQRTSVLRSEFFPNLVCSSAIRKYIDVIGISVIGGIIREWVSSGMKESPYEIASLLSQTVLQILFGMSPQPTE